MSNSLISLGLGLGGGKASTSSGRISGGGATPFTNTYSVDFDGTDDYVTMSNPTSLNFQGSFTISLWVMYTNISSSFNFLVDKSTGVTTRQYSLYLRNQTTGTKTFSFYGVDSVGNQQFFNSTGSIAVNTWNHVAVVCNSGVTDGTKLYINGVAETLGTFTVASNASAPFQLGKRSDNSFLHQGLMDEVAVFDSALAASYIASIYNNGTPNDISSLNPVGWWRMGDNDGGTGTTITDQGSGGNDGTLTNGPTFSTNVPYVLPSITNTYSVDLDGSDDYIDCGGDAAFSFTDGAGNDDPFSISAWVKLDANTRARVVAKGNLEWLFGTNSSNRFSFYLWSNDGTSAYLSVEENAGLTLGTWHHLVATYDGSNAQSGIKLYRAGSLVTMNNISVGTYAGMASQQGALRIGQWEVNSSVMNGLVDEVSVFDYELTSSQISDIYNGGSPADISSLSPLGWWRMGDNDGGTGTTITDQGSGGNNGTLTNGPTFSTTVPS